MRAMKDKGSSHGSNADRTRTKPRFTSMTRISTRLNGHRRKAVPTSLFCPLCFCRLVYNSLLPSLPADCRMPEKTH